MVKITEITKKEAQKIAEDNPSRKQGQWKQLALKIISDGLPRTIKGVTRGQAWGIKRTMENNHLVCTIFDKGTSIVISKPASE